MAERPFNSAPPLPGQDNYDILVLLDGMTFSNDQFAVVTGIDWEATDADTLVVDELGAFDRSDSHSSDVTWTLWQSTSRPTDPSDHPQNGHRWGSYARYFLHGSDGTIITAYIYGFADGQMLMAVDNVGNTTGVGAFLGRRFAEEGQYQPFVLNVNGPINTDITEPISYENEDLEAFCFAEGTRIDTPEGPVAVEDLAEGQLVLTVSGAVRPVKWIGQLASRPARHRRPWEVQPVRVKAGAFGHNIPAHDVRLSPGHAVYVDGVLVPVGHLVNGATIVQEEVERIRYFHVELETHDVLLAEGLPCESYLDDGNRMSFRNAGAFTELHGRLDPKSWDDACAPLVAAGPQLTEIQQRLHARAEELGWVRSEESRLAIIADGVEIAPSHSTGNRYWFSVPAAAEFKLRSGSGVLAHVMPGMTDNRRLGVAVAALRIDGQAVALDADSFGVGFYPLEKHEHRSWRWTNGEATLKLAVVAPAMLEVEVLMVAPSWVRPRPALRIVA